MIAGVPAPVFPSGCAVVIGATGGLGCAAARLFAENAVPVVIGYRSRRDEAVALASEIEASSGRTLPVHCDTANRESVESLFKSAIAAFGSVHSVLCAQGQQFTMSRFSEAEPDSLRRKFEIDVIGFLNVMQCCLPKMRESGGGAVTAVVSPTIARFFDGYGMGMTTKAGLAGMVRYFAVEEGPHNIRVNAIAPGAIDAGMMHDLARASPPGQLDGVAARTPLRRLGTAAEMAELLYFLSSRRAGFITGQIIHADGGLAL